MITSDVVGKGQKMEKCFKTDYLEGNVDFEELDRYVHEWGVHDEDPRTLCEFLGFDADEEDVWIDEGDDALKEMLDKLKK